MSDEEIIHAQIEEAVSLALQSRIGKPFTEENKAGAARMIGKELERAGFFDFDKHVRITTETDKPTRSMKLIFTAITPYGEIIVNYMKSLET